MLYYDGIYSRVGNLVVGTVRSNGLHDDSFFRKNKQARKMSGRHKRRIKSELRIFEHFEFAKIQHIKNTQHI